MVKCTTRSISKITPFYNDIEIDLLFRRDTSQRFHRFHHHSPPSAAQKTAQHLPLGHHRFLLDVLHSGRHRIDLLGLVSGRFRLPGVYVVVVGVPHGLLLLNMLRWLRPIDLSPSTIRCCIGRTWRLVSCAVSSFSVPFYSFFSSNWSSYSGWFLCAVMCGYPTSKSVYLSCSFRSSRASSSISRCTGWPRLTCVNLDRLV